MALELVFFCSAGVGTAVDGNIAAVNEDLLENLMQLDAVKLNEVFVCWWIAPSQF